MVKIACFIGEGNGTPLQYSCLENPTEEPGRLQSMGSLRVGHDLATSLSLFTFMHWRRKWQPTPVFLPGESLGRGAWWAAIYGAAQSRTRLKQLSSSMWEAQLDLNQDQSNISHSSDYHLLILFGPGSPLHPHQSLLIFGPVTS